MQFHRFGFAVLYVVLAMQTVLSSHAAAADEVDWPNFNFEFTGLVAPALTHITHCGDGSGRLFLVQKNGEIRVLQDGKISTNRFLDIRGRVLMGIERGLFSVAFAPDFESSGHFFLNYTRRPDGATVISRFTVGTNTNSVDATTEQVLMVVPQPSAVHNGGQIAFGPDGYLYIGMGDGGPQNDPGNTAQNTTNLLGKMLRIDVSGSTTDYTVPPTNPFVGRYNVAPEIWASGLRNPWRFSFDALTGDLYIADVGEARMEEVNFQPANSPGGENYGWSFFEGTLPFKTDLPAPSGLVFPVATYGRPAGRCVTGGVVIRTTVTDRSNGVYIYSDFVTGRVFGLKRVNNTWHHADFGIARNPGGQPLTLTSFGVDDQGAVYAVDGTVQGAGSGIFRVRDQLRAHIPTLSMANGTYQSEQKLILSSLSRGAQIHYTLDGSEPDETSAFVLSGETLSIKETTTIRSKAYREDLAPSPVSAGNYTLAVGLSVDPGKGPVTNGTQLTIRASTTNAVVRYTLDGSQPTDISPVFTNTLTLSGNETLQVVATRQGWTSAETNIFFGLLIPEWVTVQTVAGTSRQGLGDGPARDASFSFPYGICLDAAGNVFVSEVSTITIGQYQPVRALLTNGMVTTVWTNLGLPYGIASDGADNVFVAESGWNHVFRGTQGEPLEHYLSYSDFSFNSVEYLAIDGAGYAYISGGSSILKTAPGQQGQALQLTNPVHGLSVDGNDHLFVSTSSAVYKFNESGVNELFAGSVPGHTDGPRLNSGFDLSPSHYRPEYQPRSLTFGTDGSLFVADGDAVRRISTDGVVGTLQGSTSSTPGFTVDAIVGIAAHPNGDIYAIANRQIKRITRDSDRDGIADADETIPFTVGIDDRAVDTDADGSNNSMEYLAGTDPSDSASLPQLLALKTESGLQLSWSGTAPRGEILLEQSANLTNWVSITNTIYAGPTTVPFSGTRSFLRARID